MMKPPFKSSASAALPEQKLLAALANEPDVGPALAALKVASDRFNAIRAKLNDETIEESATRREADARTALVRAQALSEIGNATSNDVATARAELQAATEALQGIAGRDEVLADELRKVQQEVSQSHEVLQEAFSKWRSTALDAARATAAEGVRLIQVAALTADTLNVGWGMVPRHINDVGNWLLLNDVNFTARPAPPVADAAATTVQLLVRADSIKAEEVRVPRRVTKPALAERQASGIAPTIAAPGIPHSLTHDALGNVLPEARRAVARQETSRSAPYDDGRGGAEEVA
jgi:hypothetical protein